MKHNKYLKTMLAAIVSTAVTASVYSNLPFRFLSPPGTDFKAYVATVQRRRKPR